MRGNQPPRKSILKRIVQSLRRAAFRLMWQRMHRAGYFASHVHYSDWRETLHKPSGALAAVDVQKPRPEPLFAALDFSGSQVVFPGPYTVEMERSIKRHESYWLPRMFEVASSGTVLDVGCGFGRSLDWLHRRFDRAIGVDLAQHAVDLARDRYRAVAGVEFHACDGERLPAAIADASVDLVYCFNVLQHIPREFTRNYLAEFRRVLTPTGKAIFNVLSGVNEQTRRGPWLREWTIGHSRQELDEMVRAASLRTYRTCEWRLASGGASWIWTEARRDE